MKHFIFFVFVLLFFSCEKEDFSYNYPEVNKLLISVTRTDANSEFKTELKYDEFNRLTEVKNVFPDSQVTVESYIYNEENRIIEKSIDNYITIYTYNSTGQLTEQNVHHISPQDGYEWNEKTEFKYKNGKINEGIQYSSKGEIISYINYKYDSTGNTLEKIVRAAGESEFKLVEIKFKYDTQVNPFTDSGVNMLNGFTYTQHADIKQVNNPIYSFYMNSVLSSFPPEYEISYEYDPDGLPVYAVLNNVRFPDQEPVNVVYKYRAIE